MSCIEAEYIPYHAVTSLGRGPVMVFAPHPDDEVFGCAGAILQHVSDGDRVRVVIVTDGAYGAGPNRPQITSIRQEESRAAASVLDYGEPEFWALPDRGLVANEELIERIERELQRYAPAWVYAPSWWEIHPDHTALSLAVTEAIRRYSGAISLVMYEIGMTLPPNRLLDITHTLERKRTAMACFGSQLTSQPYDQHVLSLNRYRTFTLPGHVLAAEAYRVIEGSALLPGWRDSLSVRMNEVVGISSDKSEAESS